MKKKTRNAFYVSNEEKRTDIAEILDKLKAVLNEIGIRIYEYSPRKHGFLWNRCFIEKYLISSNTIITLDYTHGRRKNNEGKKLEEIILAIEHFYLELNESEAVRKLKNSIKECGLE